MAACHSAPVKSVRWRLDEDFLLVSCTDGRLYVWQIETGNHGKDTFHLSDIWFCHNSYNLLVHGDVFCVQVLWIAVWKEKQLVLF